MKYAIHDRVTALAGLTQAVYLIRQIARTGMCDQEAFEANVASVLAIETDSTAAVYGGLDRIELGLKQLQRQLSGDREMEGMRYSIQLLQLERKLRRKPQLIGRIREGIEQVGELRLHLPLTHASVLSCLADTYRETMSTLTPRILVQGEATLLQRPENIDRIRALLLSGVRAAMLWRQVGGSRLDLLLRGRAMAESAEHLLSRIYDESLH